MIGRWCLYLAVLLGSVVFYWAYQQWLAWLLLVTVLILPLLILVVSLPAMLSMRLRIRCAGLLEIGMEERPEFLVRCVLPVPPHRGRIRVTRTITGENWNLKLGDALPTEHCGQLVCKLQKVYVYDYLCLFRLPVYRKENGAAIVRPAAMAVNALPDLEQYMARAWRPKPGGGFAENHELRLYRPGDNLNQVHWKLTAKTGKLVIREAMEPHKGLVLLTMDLLGSGEELDRKFGRLLWIGRHLLQQGLSYELHALTGSGIQTWEITHETQLQKAVDRLLCQPPAQSGSVRERQIAASWHFHIGGEKDEA